MAVGVDSGVGVVDGSGNNDGGSIDGIFGNSVGGGVAGSSSDVLLVLIRVETLMTYCSFVYSRKPLFFFILPVF